MTDEKQPIRVWHVDDNRDFQWTIARILNEGGYLVTTTGTAKEARAMIPDRVRDFKVAILDSNLGDGSGEQIAKLLREKEIPIGIIGLATGKTPWADISFNKLDGSSDEQIARWLAAIAELTARK